MLMYHSQGVLTVRPADKREIPSRVRKQLSYYPTIVDSTGVVDTLSLRHLPASIDGRMRRMYKREFGLVSQTEH